MKVEEVSGVEVKYFKVNNKNRSLSETDCFKYYRESGYNVYFGYAKVIRDIGKVKVTKNPKSSINKMVLAIPNFPQEVKSIFKKYKSGEPDLLIEKDGIWEFVEVKTTNDSLHPNQLIFIDKLSKVHKTSIHYFIETSTFIEDEKKTPTERNFNKVISKLNTIFEQDLDKLIKTQIRKNYNKYWVIANIYKLYPRLVSSEALINTLNIKTGLDKKTILWYIDKNGRTIIQDAIKKFKDKKLSQREEKLLIEYKKLLT